jgi:leucyl aminopeptidase
VIVGHAGKRVLIGNTDAEGRLVLADVLSNLRSRVAARPDAFPRPAFLSLATLTGHASRSFGAYACATDSGAARAAGGLAPRLAAAGARLGAPLEVSSLRREDFAFIAPGCHGTPVSACGDVYDVLQSNNAPTAVTTRGHQFPMAFLLIASGLEDHGAGSALPLPYCHIDLADSVADARGVETGSPIVGLFGHFLLGLSR